MAGYRFAQIYVLALAVLLLGCTKPNQYQPPPPPPVTVSHPVEREIVATLEQTGTTEPFEYVEIRPRVQGYLQSLHFEAGADVEKGDLLYVIDPRPFEAKLSEAKAALALAGARLASSNADVDQAVVEARNAESQYRRAERAAHAGAVTASELDDMRTAWDGANSGVTVAQAQVESAQAGIESARAAIRQAELDLEYTRITAPIDGRVGRTLVDVGNLVGSGEPTHLTTIVRYDPIFANFAISEVELLQFLREKLEEGGNQALARSRETARKMRRVNLGLADEEGFPHEGHVDYADLAVDEGTGTFAVRAVFDNPQRLIPPGAFVRIEVPMEKTTALLVDERAVGRDQGGTYLLTINSDNVVEHRPVEVGNSVDGMSVIRSGITTDDWVIVDGIQRARPGAKVNPQRPGASNDSKSADAPLPSPTD